MAVEATEMERRVALDLTESERAALLRVLYVVKDNFWLDEVEESLLERLAPTGDSMRLRQEIVEAAPGELSE